MLAGQEAPVDVAQDGLSIQSHAGVFQFDQRECHFGWRLAVMNATKMTLQDRLSHLHLELLTPFERLGEGGHQLRNLLEVFQAYDFHR